MRIRVAIIEQDTGYLEKIMVTDLKNNVLTEINGITLCMDPKGKNGAYKNRGEHIYKGNRADSLWGPLLFQ